jgi:hypothetical protein
MSGSAVGLLHLDTLSAKIQTACQTESLVAANGVADMFHGIGHQAGVNMQRCIHVTLIRHAWRTSAPVEPMASRGPLCYILEAFPPAGRQRRARGR